MIENFTLIVMMAIIIASTANSRLFPVPQFIFPSISRKFPVRLLREFADKLLIKCRILTAGKALAAGADEIPGYFAGSRESAPRSADRRVMDPARSGAGRAAERRAGSGVTC
jgi:hypothetical protein